MIYTSYFGNVKRIMGEHPKMMFVSIAGKTPDWFLNEPNCIQFKKLAPKYTWWREWHDTFATDLESAASKEWYESKYRETVLGALDQKEVQQELLELSGRLNVCLLCYETPEKFCHRHLVQKWLNEGGVECTELIVTRKENKA